MLRLRRTAGRHGGGTKHAQAEMVAGGPWRQDGISPPSSVALCMVLVGGVPSVVAGVGARARPPGGVCGVTVLSAVCFSVPIHVAARWHKSYLCVAARHSAGHPRSGSEFGRPARSGCATRATGRGLHDFVELRCLWPRRHCAVRLCLTVHLRARRRCAAIRKRSLPIFQSCRFSSVSRADSKWHNMAQHPD